MSFYKIHQLDAKDAFFGQVQNLYTLGPKISLERIRQILNKAAEKQKYIFTNTECLSNYVSFAAQFTLDMLLEKHQEKSSYSYAERCILFDLLVEDFCIINDSERYQFIIAFYTNKLSEEELRNRISIVEDPLLNNQYVSRIISYKDWFVKHVIHKTFTINGNSYSGDRAILRPGGYDFGLGKKVQQEIIKTASPKEIEYYKTIRYILSKTNAANIKQTSTQVLQGLHFSNEALKQYAHSVIQALKGESET